MASLLTFLVLSSGWIQLCKIRQSACVRSLFGLAKCLPKVSHCYKHKCIREGEGCTKCLPREKFCSKINRCISSSADCVGPRVCPPHQFKCSELGGCINNTLTCEPKMPPPSAIVYKTVWPYETLSSVKPSLFGAANTIDITWVSSGESQGKLQYHDGSKWVSVSGISPSTALVVGGSNRLRFLYNNTNHHGIVLLNYTIKADRVGQKIDASSVARSADQVIALIKLPHYPLPYPSEKGHRCEVKEDSRGDEGFKIGDKIRLGAVNVTTESHIPSEILPSLQRAAIKCYFEALKDVRQSKSIMAIVAFESSSKQGEFQVFDRRWSSLKPSMSSPVVTNAEQKVRFVPAPNYNGLISAQFVSGVVQRHDPRIPATTFDLPSTVRTLVAIHLVGKNASRAIRTQYVRVMVSLQSSRTRPSKANILRAITTLDARLAAGVDKTAMAAVRRIITKAFDDALIVDGRAAALPHYRTVIIGSGDNQKVLRLGHRPLTIFCRVTPVNDAPVLTSYRVNLPSIAYNLTTNPNNGFTVHEIATWTPIRNGRNIPSSAERPSPLITDVDGRKAGIGIAFASNSSFGAFYYKDNDTATWKIVNINNKMVNGKLVGQKDLLLLKPSAKVRFMMYSNDHFWTNAEGLKKAFIFLVAWDQTDNKTNGIHKFNFPPSKNASISKKFAMAFMTRKGCDGRPGSKGRVDVCGRCGGDGVWCRGCDGVAFSGAKTDRCGNCTGGTTNKTKNFRLDCGGGCGTSFRDKCNGCQTYGRIRNLTDCTGRCFGKAKRNKCGKCVLGTTGKRQNFGEDACGKCGGNNKTCLDCAGVPDGGKKVDTCGTCLLPSDKRFDSNCTKLGRISPISGKHTGGTLVTVRGAGLQRYSTATCTFFIGAGATQVVSAVSIRNKKFVITTVSIAAGKYSLKCRFNGDSTDYVASNNFTFYNKSAITFSSISPNETEADTGAINATVTGSGFVDTGFIRCVSNKRISSPAIFLSATSVKCLFPNVPKSDSLRMAIAFGEQDTAVTKVKSVGFNIYAESPHPISITFTLNLQALIVVFNRPWKLKGTSCGLVFVASPGFRRLGSRTKCVKRTPLIMFVLLRGRPTVAPNDKLEFKRGSLKRESELVTKAMPGTFNLTIQGPTNVIVPKAILSGPNKVGACAKIRLSAAKSRGAGGRRLKFVWFAEWASDQDMGAVNQNATDDLTAINVYLAGLPEFSPRVTITKNNVKLNLKYKFGVRVKNFLGQTSTNATLGVVRENRTLPSISVGETTREVKASRDVTIQVKIQLSPCLKEFAIKVIVSWELPAVGINIGVTDKPRLRIKKGTLQGGKTYPLTVTIAMESDQTLSTTKSISLAVESSPLIARIKGGSKRVVGANGTLKLDGSKTIDPDGSSDTSWTKWECFDMTDIPCFKPDPSNPGQEVRVVLPTDIKIFIDVASTLQSGKKYKFKMTYTKGSRSASTQVVIEVKSGSPPEIDIRPQKGNKENPTKNIIIKASVKSIMTVTSVTWECVDEDGFGYLDLTTPNAILTQLSFELKKKAGRSKASINFALVIADHVLADGVQYKFRITAGDATTVETIITTNAAPSQGILEISPSNGTAMETLFTVGANEDWSDDADDLPLKYQFGYYRKGNSGKEVPLGMFDEASEIENIKFPPGDSNNNNYLTVFVDCKDQLGAITRQETTITVLPKVIDTALLESAEQDIQKEFDAENWNAAFARIGSLMSALLSGSSGDANQTAAVTATKEALAGSTMNILELGGVTDDSDAKTTTYYTMAAITEGGNNMTEAIKTRIIKLIVEIETAEIGGARRRRRAAEDSSSVEVYNVAQAETTLSIPSNVIDPNAYDANTMILKSSFLQVVDSTGKKVCAGLAIGMPASIVKNTLVVLRSEKNSFSTVDTTFTDMACNDCPSHLSHSAKVLLGTTLKDMYESWNCSDEDALCSGTCLITNQFVYDLQSSAPDNTSLTNVVDLKLLNPETYAAIPISTLATPVTYRLPVKTNVTVGSDTYYECKRWTGSSWTSTGCVTNHAIVTDNGTQYIECNCTQISYLAAFITPKSPTTEPPTTVVTTLSTTVAAPGPQIRRVRLELLGDFNKIVMPSTINQVKADITKSLASTMEIIVSRIFNVTLSKGSIIVNCVLQPSSSDTDASLATTLGKLETAVKSSTFTVALSSGQNLTADPNSFSYTVGSTVPTAPAPITPVPATESSGLSQTTIIIIAVVCGGVVLIILIVIVVIFCRKKQGESKVSPDNSREDLRDRENVEMAERAKTDGNYNKVAIA